MQSHFLKKKYLLTPGPTQIPEPVLAQLAQPILHHRTPEFIEIMHKIQSGLQEIFQTKQNVLILSASGTGAMDACVSNLFSPGDPVITINGGKFGERWTKIAQAYGLNVIELKTARGSSIDPQTVAETLKQNPHARAVLFQASETSTGTLFPTQEICKIIQAYPQCISIVDAITALGVFDLPMDSWGIDVLLTGSQKALMLPPGLACVSLSEKAWDWQKKAQLPRFYFDFAKERQAILKGQTAWTPPIHLILGLQKSLELIQAETLQISFKRHALLAKCTRAAIQALGLSLLSEAPSNAVTAVKVPVEIQEGKLIPKTMREQYGVSIAGGQDELEGKIFRLSHLGYVGIFDLIVGLGALEMTLYKLGYRSFTFGTATGAALQTYYQQEIQ